jgi:hypothetical protein
MSVYVLNRKAWVHLGNFFCGYLGNYVLKQEQFSTVPVTLSYSYNAGIFRVKQSMYTLVKEGSRLNTWMHTLQKIK